MDIIAREEIMSKEINVGPEEYRISCKLDFISNQYVATICMLNELFHNGTIKECDTEFALEQFERLSCQVAELMSYARVIQGSDL